MGYLLCRKKMRRSFDSLWSLRMTTWVVIEATNTHLRHCNLFTFII